MLSEYPIGMRGTMACLPCIASYAWCRGLVVTGGCDTYAVLSATTGETGFVTGYLCDIDGLGEAVVRHEWIVPLPPPEQDRSEIEKLRDLADPCRA